MFGELTVGIIVKTVFVENLIRRKPCVRLIQPVVRCIQKRHRRIETKLA